MPRTKRPTKKTERVLEGGETKKSDLLKKLDKIVTEQKKKLDEHMHMEVRNIELAFKMFVGTLSKEQLNKTVGQMKSELSLPETRHRRSTRAGSHDDGYITENSSQDSEGRSKKRMAPPSSGRSVPRRSRSADATARKLALAPAPATAQRRRSRSVYRTPAYNKNTSAAYPAITPKVAPHTPLTVLRQPRQGEMVVSMTGSPVIVPTFSTMQPDEKANCNILLKDGTMLSLQPKHLRQSQAYIPFSLMDTGVIAQLKTLKENIDKVVMLGERSMK